MTMNATFSCVSRAWRDHEAELRRYLTHRTGSRHLAEDVMQDVFVKAMRQGDGFCRLDNARAWLFQVARNAVVDQYRVRREWDEVPEDVAAPEAQFEPIDALSDCVGRVLQELPADDRSIIEQCDLAGMKQRDYAASHGLSLPAVKARLLRARQKMRLTLTRNCQVRFDAAGRVEAHIPRS